jgi:hypothetical protein
MTDRRVPGSRGVPASADALSRIAWLRPYYMDLAQRNVFANLSPSHQFHALIDRIAGDHPDRAAKLAGATAAAARAILDRLAALTGTRGSMREVALWTVRKGSRELRCVAIYQPNGIDLRLLEGADFRRTALYADPAALTPGAAEWLRRLVQRGWVMLEADHDPAAGGTTASRS